MSALKIAVGSLRELVPDELSALADEDHVEDFMPQTIRMALSDIVSGYIGLDSCARAFLTDNMVDVLHGRTTVEDLDRQGVPL